MLRAAWNGKWSILFDHRSITMFWLEIESSSFSIIRTLFAFCLPCICVLKKKFVCFCWKSFISTLSMLTKNGFPQTIPKYVQFPVKRYFIVLEHMEDSLKKKITQYLYYRLWAIHCNIVIIVIIIMYPECICIMQFQTLVFTHISVHK